MKKILKLKSLSKRYLFLGGTSGIGYDVARRLLDQNNYLYFVCRNEEKLFKLFSNYSQYSSILVDFNFPEDLFDKLSTYNFKNKLDGLVYCVGVEETFPIKLYNQDKLTKLFNINFFSLFQSLRFFSNKLISNNNSSIVVLSSVMSEMGQPGKTAYCSSKSAITGLIKSLSLELSSRKITVNSISPSIITTPMGNKIISKLSESQLSEFNYKHPLGFGEVNDITELILFLLSDKSKWITGQNIKIDGGYSSI